MDFLAAVIIFTISLFLSVIYNIQIILPLFIGLGGFIACGLYRGFKFGGILTMMGHGMKKLSLVLQIFALIGLITGVWRSSGTIAYFVFYGTKWINPSFFILLAFLLTCLVSFILGTSFGTFGTIGVVLMVLARSGHVDLNLAAGAIISGAYFGDRCSPTSSSANLVAALTDTRLYANVRNMFRTGNLPFIVSVLLYAVFSIKYPLTNADYGLLNDLSGNFQLSPLVILPAAVIFILILLQVQVKWAMLFSVVTGMLVCGFVQQMNLVDVFKTLIFGYHPPASENLAKIMSGGGLLSMVNPSLIVLIASAYSGIFEETGMLFEIEACLVKLSRRITVFPTTLIASIFLAIFSCTQALTIILTEELMDKIYKANNLSNSQLAVDLENTAVLTAVLIPWNVAIALPLVTLGADRKSILYAFFLYLVPLINLLRKPKISSVSNNPLEGQEKQTMR